MMLNEIKIKYFLVLAKTLSFTKAANQLFITQQTLSKQISNMEDDVGFPLFERTTKSVRLTKGGQELFQFLATTSDEYERLINYAKVCNRNLGVGLLTGMSIVSIRDKVIRPAGNQLAPYSTFVHAMISLDEMWKALDEGRIDLGFFPGGVQGTTSIRLLSGGPKVVEVYRDHLYFYVAKEYARGKEQGTIRDFADHTFFVPPPDVPAYNQTEQILAENGLENVLRGRPPSQASAIEATSNGNGISFADSFSAMARNMDLMAFELPYESSLMCAYFPEKVDKATKLLVENMVHNFNVRMMGD